MSKLEKMLLHHDSLQKFYKATVFQAFQYKQQLAFKKRRAALLSAWQDDGCPETMSTVDGIKMYIDPSTNDADLYELFKNGRTYEPGVTSLFKKTLTKGMTVVDAGANNGYYSLLSSKLVGRKGIVYAFEPSAETFKRLKANIKLNGFTNIRAFNVALASKPGKATLYKLPTADASASLIQLPGFVTEKTVELCSLDSYGFGNMDLIKIDVEGSELDVLHGASNTIQKSPNLNIIAEYLLDLAKSPYDALFSFVDMHGFNVREILEAELGKEITSHNQLSHAYANIWCYRKDKHIK